MSASTKQSLFGFAIEQLRACDTYHAFANVFLRIVQRQYVAVPTDTNHVMHAWWDDEDFSVKFGKGKMDRLLGAVNSSSHPLVLSLVACHRYINKCRGKKRRGFELIPNRLLPAGFKAGRWFVPDQKKLDAENAFYLEAAKKWPELVNSEMYSHLQNQAGLSDFPNGALQYLKGKIIIDGGAWRGDTALIIQNATGEKVYAFEPLPENIATLAKISSCYPRIIPVQMGLSDRQGVLSFEPPHADDKIMGGGRLTEHPTVRTEQVAITTIDEFTKGRNEPCGLIKLDVEGLESNVVDGALETIKRDRPLLAISIYHNPGDFFEIAPKLKELGLGYNFLVRATSETCLLSEIMLIGWPESISRN